MSTSKPAKTLAQVFDEFLADQKDRLSHKTYLKYSDIIDLYRSYLEGYWPGHDGEYERVTKAGGTYCGTYGPEDIAGAFFMFLDYFMPHKVIAGEGTRKAGGTVIKKLAKWLTAQGYAADADDAVE